MLSVRVYSNYYTVLAVRFLYVRKSRFYRAALALVLWVCKYGGVLLCAFKKGSKALAASVVYNYRIKAVIGEAVREARS